MVIGSGMMANAFSRYQVDGNVVVFASGVANSHEVDGDKFQREVALLLRTIEKNPEKRLVYFSTCSVYDPDVSTSAYVLHKTKMEGLVEAKTRSHHIFRLPQVVGISRNRTTLVNYLIDKISTGSHFLVWKNAVRYIIDVDDVSSIGGQIIDDAVMLDQKINIASRAFSIYHIVSAIERHLGLKASYTLVDRGSPYAFDHSASDCIARSLGISFDEQYLDRVIKKYF